MRRKDREMDREFGLNIIDNSQYGTIALADNNETYSLPLSIVRYNDKLYFHSARNGRKIDILDKEPRVSISFVGNVEVPDIFSERELEDIVENNKINEILSKVYTTEFESAIVFGNVKKETENDIIIKALKLICEKYTKDKMKYFEFAIEKSLDLVNIYSVEIDDLSSKRKKL